jgi:hypothetical protein
VSDTALDAKIDIGATLLEAGRLALRHWFLGLVAIAAMAGLFLLLIYLAGLCIGDGYNAACIDPRSLVLPRHQGDALVGDVVEVATLMVAFAVSVAMVRLFYLDERIAAGNPAQIGLRIGRFLARSLLVWMIVIAPAILLEVAYSHASWALYPDRASPVTLWFGYVAVRLTSLSLACYLHSRMLLYVPAVVYQERPEGFRALWQRTERVRWRLFIVVWLIALAIAITQTVADTLAPVAVDLTPIVEGLASWSHLGAAYINALLSRLIVYSILGPADGLWVAGVSIIAYRKLIMIDQHRAAVFD